MTIDSDIETGMLVQTLSVAPNVTIGEGILFIHVGNVLDIILIFLILSHVKFVLWLIVM
jgi:hypothetical protein